MIIGIRNSVLQRIPIKAACNGYYLRWWYNGWHYWFFLPGDHTINTEGERYFTLSTRTITMSSGQVTREQAAAIRTIFFTKEVYLLGIAGWMEIRIEPGSPVIYNNMVAGTEIEITAHIGSREISYTSGYTPVPDLPIVAPSEPVMCELIIGTQIWACYNVETDYPGSKVYGEDEANRSVFGGLYNWTQIMASGFCPEGWHVPTLAEWQTLIDFLGGDATAGGHLKSIEAIHWNAPNVDADDSVNFSGRGAGVGTVNSFTGILEFMHLLAYEYFWTADEADAPWSELSAKVVRLAYNSGAVVKTIANKLNSYLSVRLIKNITAYPYTIYGGTSGSGLIIKSTDGGSSFTSEGSAGKGNPTCFVKTTNGDILYGTDTGWVVNKTTGGSAFTAGSVINVIVENPNTANQILIGNEAGGWWACNDYTVSLAFINISNFGVAIRAVHLEAGFSLWFCEGNIYRNNPASPVQVGDFTCVCKTDAGVLYAGTNRFTGAFMDFGAVYKSIDDGASWVQINDVIDGDLKMDCMLYNNGRILIGASMTGGTTAAGIFYSDDEFVNPVTQVGNTEVAASSLIQIAGNIIVSANKLAGIHVASVFQSDDNGTTWTKKPGSPILGENAINCIIKA